MVKKIHTEMMEKLIVEVYENIVMGEQQKVISIRRGVPAQVLIKIMSQLIRN